MKIRPMPPAEMLIIDDFDQLIYNEIKPAPDLWDWIKSEIISPDGSIHNDEHSHLMDANIGVLWAQRSFRKQGRGVVGQAEQLAFRAGGWQKARQELQMRDWFGGIPDYLITFAADFCYECSDAEFCALVEHELYHIRQKSDAFGAPKFNQEGMPVLELRGHDVEEFVGVVRRYGASEAVQEMIDAAKGDPEVSRINISRACGTCLLKLA